MRGEDCECPRRILLVVQLGSGLGGCSGGEEPHRVEGGVGVRQYLGKKGMLRVTAREDRRQSIGFIRWLLLNSDLCMERRRHGLEARSARLSRLSR